jgi:hypothetical protein
MNMLTWPMPRRTSGGGEKRIEVPGSGATPIVHVGFPKTASTWFQKAFYPHVRSPRYVGREKLFSALIEPNALTFDPAGAVSTLGLKAGEAVLLSDECLCGYLHNGGIDGMVTREFARRIKAALPDARIVIFLRSQPGMIVAAYQQYLRSGGTYSAHRFLFPKDHLEGPEAVTYKQPRFDLDYFFYSRIIRLYEGLFGADKVHIFLFEDFRRNGMQFLRRYAQALKLEVDWDQVCLRPRLESYGSGLTGLARALNLFTARSVLDKHCVVDLPGWYRPRRKVLETLNRTGLFGAPPSLGRLVGADAARALEARYAPDNAAVASDRGLPLREMGYPMPAIRDETMCVNSAALKMSS